MPAKEVATSRAAMKQWPLHKSTKHRLRISPGDTCLFYVGGEFDNAQSVIGAAKVQRVVIAPRRWCEPNKDIVSGPVERIVELANVELWSEPVSIRQHLPSLKFVKNKKRWGLHFMGGVTRIPTEDFQYILQQAMA